MATIKELNEILNTLPVGYYAKRNIPVEFKEGEETSYYDPIADQITISYDIINDGLEKLPADADIEVSCRSMLYHEVSHAILTPKDLMTQWSNHSSTIYDDEQEQHDVRNIFEDERIETIFKDYYLNVDFKQQILAINGISSIDKLPEPTNPISEFYYLVRFRIGDQDLINEVDNIINSARTLTIFNNNFSFDYCSAVDDLYAIIKTKYPESQKHNKEKFQLTFSDVKEVIKKIKGHEERIDNYNVYAGASNLTTEDIFTGVVNRYYNAQLINDLNCIFDQIMRRKRMTSGATHAYAGRIDPRATNRTDYRYFERHLSGGEDCGYSKLHLNMWIDDSGSFCDNEQAVNQLLRALEHIERTNKDFEFDLIKVANDMTETDKNNRMIQCQGGSSLYSDVSKLIKKHYSRDKQTVNILLVDGYFYNYKLFKPFDTKNTCVICPSYDSDMFKSFKNTRIRAIDPCSTTFADCLINETKKALASFFR